MAKYTKRGDGRYQANVFVGIDGETGKRKFETVYAKSIPELDDKKADIRDRYNKGTYSNDKGLTLGMWVEKWLALHKANAGIRTKEMYELLVNKHIIPSIGSIRLRDLKKSDIQTMINERNDKPRTCQQLKMCLTQILEGAIEDGLIYRNVCKNINLPLQIKDEKRALTDIEKKAIINANLTPKERTFVYILQYCGLRRGEALALTRNDIDFVNNTIKVKNAITFEQNDPVFKPVPKTRAGIRDITIPTILREKLLEYVPTTNMYLFEMERKDGPMTKSSYIKFWNKLVDKLNTTAGGTKDNAVINHLTAHVFRHNYATMLFYANIDLKEAQYLLGHTDVKVTLNIYTHLSRKKSNAASKLDLFLENEFD